MGFAKIIGRCFAIASEVERKDKTGLDSSVVLYESEIPKLYAQAMVLLIMFCLEMTASHLH